MATYWKERVDQRAAEDPQFRSQLKTDPRAALRSALGISIPDTVQINVVEDGPNQLTVAVPAENRGGILNQASSDVGAQADADCSTVNVGWTLGCTGSC